LSERNGAGGAQPRDGGGVVAGDEILARHQARGLRHAAEREALLDGAGHAEVRRQRRQHRRVATGGGHARVGGVGFGARLGVAARHHGVDGRVDRLDARDVRLDDGARAQLAGADAAPELGARQGQQGIERGLGADLLREYAAAPSPQSVKNARRSSPSFCG
jgi:hypothetical protein